MSEKGRDFLSSDGCVPVVLFRDAGVHFKDFCPVFVFLRMASAKKNMGGVFDEKGEMIL